MHLRDIIKHGHTTPGALYWLPDAQRVRFRIFALHDNKPFGVDFWDFWLPLGSPEHAWLVAKGNPAPVILRRVRCANRSPRGIHVLLGDHSEMVLSPGDHEYKTLGRALPFVDDPLLDAQFSGDKQSPARLLPTRRRRQLEARGVRVGRFLGRGHHGCVWESGEGRVVKITLRSNEADVFRFLQEHPHKHLPISYGCHIVGRVSRHDAIAVVREDVPDWPFTSPKKWDEGTTGLDASIYDKHSTKASRQEAHRAAANVIHTGDVPALNALTQLLEDTRNHTPIRVHDLHAANIGRRADGTLVIRDLSNSEVLEATRERVPSSLQTGPISAHSKQ